MGLKFEWDEKKAAANLRKHGVSFEEAASAFADPLSLTIPDPEHWQNEERFILLGISERDRLVVVAHIEPSEVVRLISARRATPAERRDYEEGES